MARRVGRYVLNPMADLRFFGPEDVPRGVRGHAEALWAWYGAAGSNPKAAPDDLRRIEGGGEPETGREAWRAAGRACRDCGLDPSLLVPRVRAAARLATGPAIIDGADLNDFSEDWCGAHARLVARLLGLKGAWQQDMASELARGFFLVETVIRAREHAERKWSFFPTVDIDRFEAEKHDRDSPEVRKLLWKQAVRARDALAQGRPLIDEMSPLLAFRARITWFAALELLLLAETRSWDVWSREPSKGPATRFRIVLQAVAGKTAFRKR